MDISETEHDAATGWHTFAGITTSLLGVFNLVEGLLTLVNDRYGAQIGSAFFFFNLTGWGWLHLLLGLALLGVGIALLGRLDWAPAVAVGLAGATAIFQMIYVNIIPTWSWVNVALAMLIIYALVVRGRDALAVMSSYRPGSLFAPPGSATPAPTTTTEPEEHDRP